MQFLTCMTMYLHSMIEWELLQKKVHPKSFQNPFLLCPGVPWLGIVEMDFEMILGVPFFCSNSHSIILWLSTEVTKSKIEALVFIAL